MKITESSFDCIFAIPAEPLTAFSGDAPAFRAAVQDGALCVSVWYTVNEAPLVLTAKVTQGTATLRVRPYRLELWCGGTLFDEEWPYGDLRMADAEWSSPVQIAPFTEESASLPAVLGSFENAEGWKPEENVFVGDCMPYSDGKRFHVLYLKDRHHHCSKWHRGAHQWAHISSDDLVHWQIHPMAVEIDAPWEGSICTGSWIADGTAEYLFYAIRTCDGSPALICRSVSVDGVHFVKDRAFRFALSDRYWGASARDPKVIAGADGHFHMFVTTTLLSEKRGALAHLISDDLTHWTELPEPIFLAPDENEPECSDYFCFNGTYYLIYSLHGNGLYLYSDQPFSDWKTPEEPLIPCKSVPKMALWNGKVIFVGFDGHGEYAGTMTFRTTVPNGAEMFPKA